MLAVGLLPGGISLYDTSTWKKVCSLLGHDDYINSLAFSPDSRRLVSGSDDKAIRVWDCSNGELLATMDGHTLTVYSVVFSPCGKKVASTSEDKTVRLWDSVTGEPLFVLEGHKSSVNSVKFTPDGSRLVSCADDKTIRFWDVETGAPGDVWEPGHGPVMCLDISPDGHQLVSGHHDGTLKLWSTASGSPGPDLDGHSNSILRVLFSADGQRIASASFDITVRLWDLSSGVLVSEFISTISPVDISFSPNGQHLASIDTSIFSIAFSPDMNLTAAESGDGDIQLWDLRNGELGPTLEGHTDDVVRLTFSPCGRWIASTSKDETVRLWELENNGQGHVLANMNCGTYGASTINFSPTGLELAAGDVDGAVNIFDTQSRTLLRTTTLEVEAIDALAYSPSGQELAIGANNHLFFWDLQSEEPELKLEVDPSGTGCIVYSPCGRWIACGSYGNTVQICRRHSSGMGAECIVAVVDGFLGRVTDIAWNPVEPLEFVTGSNDRSVRAWRISESNDSDGTAVSVDLIWGSDIGMLGTFGMIIEGVTGLGAVDQKLLLQRDAVDGTLTSEEDKSE
ncbi:WD40 repeat-like protein [Linnemannia elongata AG-77]|uniref:WD40 repeat-like protein n=1 Tax=Linnemannia elongata AG-77 TaxID=1314771 RepID=A0A197JK59_9FUNG|nr:WD40 repeat-like protein [Linnemannia elongata AG-77]